MKILIIHGPNLQLLRSREPEVYGGKTLKEINSDIRRHAKSVAATAATFQSNHEGEIVDKIGAAMRTYDGIIINPGAYTHTSVAIRDALAGVKIPAVEVHLSNTSAREEFRHHSFMTPVCRGIIAGFGPLGYLLAIDALVKGEQEE